MVQTLPAEDFSRGYSPNVVETLMQRIPGVSTNDVQGNEFSTDLRYRGFSASPVQGTPQGLHRCARGVPCGGRSGASQSEPAAAQAAVVHAPAAERPSPRLGEHTADILREIGER
jgi:hypothetical protein